MWSVPRQLEDPDERPDRLLAAYDAEIERLQSSQLPPYWDGARERTRDLLQLWSGPPAGGVAPLLTACLPSSCARIYCFPSAN